eukprot:UN04481
MDSCTPAGPSQEQCHHNDIVPQLIVFGYARSNIIQALKVNGNGKDINNIIDILEQNRNIQQYKTINYTLNHPNISPTNSPKTLSLPPKPIQKHSLKLRLNRKEFMLPSVIPIITYQNNKKIVPPPAPPSTPNNISYFIE